MITENELEALALSWLRYSGREYHRAPIIAPDGDGFEFGKMLGAMKADDKEPE